MGWGGQVHPLLWIFRKQGFTFLGNSSLLTSRSTFFVGQWREASRRLEGQPISQHTENLPLLSSPFPRSVWGTFGLLSGCSPGPSSSSNSWH